MKNWLLVCALALWAAVLLAPLPPAGLMPVAARLAAERPDYLFRMASFDPARLSTITLLTLA